MQEDCGLMGCDVMWFDIQVPHRVFGWLFNDAIGIGTVQCQTVCSMNMEHLVKLQLAGEKTCPGSTQYTQIPPYHVF